MVKLSIIDFKNSSNKERQESWIDNYFLQTTYTHKCMRTFGKNIDQIVILLPSLIIQYKTLLKKRKIICFCIDEIH